MESRLTMVTESEPGHRDAVAVGSAVTGSMRRAGRPSSWRRRSPRGQLPLETWVRLIVTVYGMWWALLVLVSMSGRASAENLIEDPSFEEPKDRDKWGLVFAKWTGWNFEGDCSFEVGDTARKAAGDKSYP
jgi:hypothetical protein